MTASKSTRQAWMASWVAAIQRVRDRWRWRKKRRVLSEADPYLYE